MGNYKKQFVQSVELLSLKLHLDMGPQITVCSDLSKYIIIVLGV